MRTSRSLFFRSLSALNELTTHQLMTTTKAPISATRIGTQLGLFVCMLIKSRCGLLPNIVSRPHVVHDIVHGWIFYLWLLSWVYEARLTNFYQGLSSWKKPQSPAGSCAVRDTAVLGKDEWRAMAEGWSPSVAYQTPYGSAEGVSQSGD